MNRKELKKDIEILKDVLHQLILQKRELNDYITEVKRDIDYHYRLLHKKRK